MQRDSCLRCRFWEPPKKRLRLGYCYQDRQTSHAGYLCGKFQSAEALAHKEHLGLTDEEIEWLRNHRHRAISRSLIRLYRMVLDCPADPGARSLFAVTLDEWRRNRPRTLLKPEGFAGDPASADEEYSYARNPNHDP
jgi:hypothetical protein